MARASLVGLPPELLLKVHHNLFANSHHAPVVLYSSSLLDPSFVGLTGGLTNSAQILRTCRHLYAHGFPWLYHNLTFLTLADEHDQLILQNLPSNSFEHVRHLRFDSFPSLAPLCSFISLQTLEIVTTQ